MDKLRNNLPFLATLVSEGIVLLAISLIELRYALWILPLFGISLLLGEKIWPLLASLMLGFTIALGSKEIQDVIGPNYSDLRTYLVFGMAFISLVQVGVYIIQSKIALVKTNRKAIARNTIFAIAGFVFIFFIIYTQVPKINNQLCGIL